MKTKICSRCKRELPIDNFSWRNKKTGRRQSECKECHRKIAKEHYKKNKKIYIKNRRRRINKLKIWFAHLKSQLKCANCGEDCIICLDFHHLESEEKDYEVAQFVYGGYSKDRIIEEIRKCIVVCSNCHRKIHAGYLEIETFIYDLDEYLSSLWSLTEEYRTFDPVDWVQFPTEALPV